MTNETKQTAVEWLESRITTLIPDDIGSQLMYKSNIKKAKEMEKEQMRKIYSSPITTNEDGNFVIKSFEQYYNETYGGKK